jgi:hypothetical protein
MNPDQAFGLTDPVAFDQVLQDGGGLLRWQARVEQWRALAFGEAGLARLAVEQPGRLKFPVAVADGEVPGVALPVERAGGILAAEAREVVHGWGSSREVADRRINGRKPQDKLELGGSQ